MKVGVLGLWHLGCVTAACLAEAGYRVVGVDFDQSRVDDLRAGRAPVFEPGLDALITQDMASGLLSFASEPGAFGDCDLVWVAIDTPVDDDDRADVTFVTDAVQRLFPHLKNGAVVLVSSQLPAGKTRQLAQGFAAQYPSKTCRFAYSPENLRLGRAIEIFKASERIVVGVDDQATRQCLEPLLAKFTDEIVWMAVESAEMVKHGLNAFLATSVVFANELASLCERVGADARDVEHGLRLEPRIGSRAYIRPGASFAGGTLARDVTFLNDLAASAKLRLPLLASVLPSNREHEQWPIRRLAERLGSLARRDIAVLGLAYKPGTDTLRRSSALTLCRTLGNLGAHVRAFDPKVTSLPEEDRAIIVLQTDVESALSQADAAIVATEWPEFRTITAASCRELMRNAVICDPNRFLAATLEDVTGIDYVTVGKP